ncbi:HERV-H LTR-associating protein 2 isoform X2 [Xyrauchen texanus]|uniref:HERV-H LTR-associating protein 2 isoform X2 n=1 Tax=Xyrauchen texanus TaxID=154827 RepID=UPI0022420FEB|nr:HERV-H LTR-associating protein 2 isoform X2 [Xyrauchen texanus]
MKQEMTGAHFWTCLLLMWILDDTNGKTPDVEITCMFSEDCVLPCHFEPVGDEIIYWYRQNVQIHSYKQGSGLIDQPDQIYKDRTSLFTDLTSIGNASLHVPKCGPKDRGKYKCLVTSGNEKSEHFFIVKVEATIKSVTLETTRLSGYEEVKCSTRDVYPAPRVTLFTEPDILPETLQPSTRKVADTQGLYSVESKLRKLKDRDDLTYICLVQSFYRTQIWRSSLQEKEIYSVEGQDLIIPCEAPWNMQNFTLTWSFIKEHKSSTIFTYDSFTQLSSSVWEEKLQLSSHSDGDGSLQLRSPLRLENTGTYNCILSAFQTKHEVRTKLNITPMTEGWKSSQAYCTGKDAAWEDRGDRGACANARSSSVSSSSTSKNVLMHLQGIPSADVCPSMAKRALRLPKSFPQWWILAAVITGFVVTAVAAVIGYVKCKVSLPQSSKTHAEATEMQPSIVTIINHEAPSEESCLTEETSNRNT